MLVTLKGKTVKVDNVYNCRETFRGSCWVSGVLTYIPVPVTGVSGVGVGFGGNFWVGVATLSGFVKGCPPCATYLSTSPFRSLPFGPVAWMSLGFRWYFSRSSLTAGDISTSASTWAVGVPSTGAASSVFLEISFQKINSKLEQDLHTFFHIPLNNYSL